MIKTVLILIVLASAFSMVFSQTTDQNRLKARQFLDLLEKGEFAIAEGYFGDEMKAAMPVEKLEEVWKSLPAQVGKLKKLGKANTSEVRGFQVVTILGEFDSMDLDIEITFDRNGRIGGFFLRPAASKDDDGEAYELPEYADPDLYREEEVTIGTGKWRLPGTLTFPNKDGKYPAVVIVHGSGPGDRDGTHVNRANKPYKDLALGLSSIGVVVLRYEKRTKQYGSVLAKDNGLTVKEEVIDDVIFAVDLLGKDQHVDPRKIFVLGHSLGGYLIPRINGRTDRIAGFISLAGATRHLEDAYLEQNRYFATLDGKITDDEKKKLVELEKLVDEIKSLTSRDRDSTKIYIGAYPPYWLDLKEYDPVEEAKSIKKPFLILQGERDYQVTMDDFARWKSVLGAKKNVTFKTYPTLNHIFMPGEGTPAPDDYSSPGHVAKTVIDDIRDWIVNINN